MMLARDINDWKNLILMNRFALKEIDTKLNILNEEFQFIHLHNPIEYIKSRVKTPESIIEKLKRKGYEPTIQNAKEYIYDIAGIRIICSFVSDIYLIYDLIQNQSDVKVIEVKDYIRNPKPNGYQSLHLIVEIPVFLSDRIEEAKVEIQIRTIAMDFWASLEHKIFYKFNKAVPGYITKQLKECADVITHLDNKMLFIKDELEQYK
ncbi:GTP pyrophosphokinase [Geosporobacter ferrireducens]|uniref:GTP pyrophosphokinase n=1 Tax=Geosporobacter ferrireducens TaxID=1424294 RepID=A0A1D8GQQ9_9FIRM|nr:GTP pyrophosphokinase family protein [Geosporobacter ferrireducens]AOT73144.1 GTP pyrophosphokinase [Geosporobacter ferrireducens]MTI57242.1 GTP pyrophosphokinase family protein [Geosporobacter ferrireducens]